ncbi:hydroxymethylbilane synthase [Kibdelosporangium banguiense]|uniref:Porphobilinogen deaminase n=1 Tax=Kibdelosporangium banguiense TaxID=1365924 RepID=A0ABS4TLZ6_9PSEU|nr:hydroxymethylbilane synthase [Kibdelosporangium banguiense]MBP2325364.1 hydroxymethylbilane synthase [Kibdelosporangium banguiense]
MTNATDTLAAELSDRFADAKLRIGTRTTPLAKAQTQRVIAQIEQVVPGLPVEVVAIQTSADLWPGDLSQLGGKGNFTKEIDKSLISGKIDIAVHSMKDVPGDVPLPKGTEFGAYLHRGDVHDVVISRDGRPLADLPPGSKIGTSAVRRRAQLSLYRPDFTIERVRGGIDSRIKKLDAGEYDAILLARTGLQRINLDDRITEVLPATWADGATMAMVPAVGAAVIGVQARTSDEPVMRLLDEINDPDTALHITAERTMLHMLRGHCNSPIAGHAHTTADGQLSLFGMVFNRDGSQWVRSHGWGPTDDPASLGAWVAGDLLRQGARRLITATRK